MEKIKVILDRKKVSAQEIASGEDFKLVLKEATKNIPIWKSWWFYGSAGLASIIMVAITMNWNHLANIATSKEHLSSASIADSEITLASNIDEQILDKEHFIDSDTKNLDYGHQLKVAEATNGLVLKTSINKGGEETPLTKIEKTNSSSETMIDSKTTSNRAKVDVTLNNMPNIGGVFYGPITIEDLCFNRKITSSPNIEITSFKINYNTNDGDVIKSVTGDVIPKDICLQLERWNLNSTVFITEIRGVSTNGEVLMLSSMSLIPTN